MPVFKEWLEKHKKSPFKAYCNVCKKGFELSNMAKRALTSHAGGKIHQKAVGLRKLRITKMEQFVKVEKKECQEKKQTEMQNVDTETLTIQSPPEETPMSSQEKPVTSGQCLLSTYVSNEDVTRAEILWAMKGVMAHFSFRSSADIGHLFQSMFPDSSIAKKFTCGKTKMNYLICFGLAPYFREKLLQKINDSECVAISFDESLNKEFQTEQMDIIVRYFYEDKVVSQYFDSQFMGRTAATDLLHHLKCSLSKFSNRKLLQISMDGPRVNWKLLSLLCEDREKDDADLPKLLNIGSCGLHIVHGAFYTGCRATDWNIDGILRALYYLFEDSPAKREDYTSITDSTIFPLNFCATRWVEDDKVAQRALEIWPNVQKYIKEVLKRSKSKQPTSASFATIAKATKDVLLPAKLQVFVYISKVLKPFLVKYQTDEPMIMFLAEDLFDMCGKLMQKFVKKSVLDSTDTMSKLANLNVLDKENHKAASAVDIGFAAKGTLVKLAKPKPVVSERGLLEFRMECIKFLSQVTNKLLERSPLKYKLVRRLFCLNPKKMVTEPEECTQAFEDVLDKLIETKWRSSTVSDDLKDQYKSFLKVVKKDSELEFQNCTQRVDTFLYMHIQNKENFKDLWSVFKLLLTLCHSQSAVERGFNVNSDTVTPNLRDKTLVSMRTVYDTVKVLKIDVSSFVVTKELIRHCRYESIVCLPSLYSNL